MLGMVLLPLQPLRAQQQSGQSAIRAEQIRELMELPSPPETEAGAGETLPMILQGQKDIGEQWILRRKKPHEPFQFLVEQTASAPDNAFLTRAEPDRDEFYTTSMGFAYLPELPDGQSLRASARASLYRYHEFRVLDFNSYDLNLSYNHSLPGAYQRWSVFARTGWSRLEYARAQSNLLGQKTAGDGDAFLKQYQLTLGMQRAVPITRFQFAYVGASMRWNHTDFVDGRGTGSPDDPERDVWSLFGGYQYLYSRAFRFLVSYRFSNSRYQYIRVPNVHRRDQKHNVTASVTYRYSKQIEFSLNWNYADNTSNSRAFEYESRGLGGGANLNWRF